MVSAIGQCVHADRRRCMVDNRGRPIGRYARAGRCVLDSAAIQSACDGPPEPDWTRVASAISTVYGSTDPSHSDSDRDPSVSDSGNDAGLRQGRATCERIPTRPTGAAIDGACVSRVEPCSTRSQRTKHARIVGGHGSIRTDSVVVEPVGGHSDNAGFADPGRANRSGSIAAISSGGAGHCCSRIREQSTAAGTTGTGQRSHDADSGLG